MKKLNEELEIISEAKVIEISDLEEQIESGDTLIGTGIDRISKKALENVQIFDDSFISAKSLIRLFHLKNRYQGLQGAQFLLGL